MIPFRLFWRLVSRLPASGGVIVWVLWVRGLQGLKMAHSELAAFLYGFAGGKGSVWLRGSL